MNETYIPEGDLARLASSLDAVAQTLADGKQNNAALSGVASGMPGASAVSTAARAGNSLDKWIGDAVNAIEGDAGNVRVTDANFQSTDVTSAGTYKNAPVESSYSGY